jgi:hypothetical protein
MPLPPLGYGRRPSVFPSHTQRQSRACLLTPTFNLKAWCEAHGRHDLLEEWAHPDMAPHEFTPASKTRVPWVCALGDHKWTVGPGR